MVDRSEQDRLMQSGGERLLMVILASVLWTLLSITKLLPVEEAVLIGWTVGFLVGYWLPPRPTIGFTRWASERIGMLAFLYVLVLKTPLLFVAPLNRNAAYAIGFVLFAGGLFAWTRHPKSTLRFGRA